MKFKLSKTVQIGNKILTFNGWRKVLDVTPDGAIIKDGLIEFGDIIYGWKAK